ncbi:MAG: aspartate ammonia-lyase [Chloroflexi bacterium]|nr:aspartate ammonia-lyase [Chloroflexota bacterium]
MRKEKDALGEREVPDEALYGVQTLRARENFAISGGRPHPALVRASALVKQAATEANMALGQLEPRLGRAIVQAAAEVAAGQWQEHFMVDPFQAGAGTSHNMNTNEVIANRAIELLGGRRGNYRLVHPNDHVNMSQSSNDFFPTAVKLGCLFLVGRLLPVLRGLEQALLAKAEEFDEVLKSGRTHLQDAVPLRLGQEFGAYASAIARASSRIEQASPELEEINLGATALGTGLNTPSRYREEVASRLSVLTGLPLRPPSDPFEVTQSTAALAALSSSLKLLALELIRIANDLRLLSSGPRTGLGEINLPPVQPGSSIMPGKVNPVMAEVMDMVALQVVGNDLVVSLATQAGQLDLNVMTPVIAHNLFSSLDLLRNGVQVFTERCISGITTNLERCRGLAERSLGLATALSPYLGYEGAVRVAQEAQARGITVRQLVLEKRLLTSEQLEEAFDLRRLTEPGLPEEQP